MLAYPCPVCYDYGCLQEHRWYSVENTVLIQTVLKGLQEILRRDNNARANYPGGAGMIDSPPHYIYSPAYPPTIYPPTFNAADSFGTKAMDALADRIQDISISPPAYSADIWAAQGSAPVSPQEGFGPSPNYDVLAPWSEGYVSVPQDAGPSGDVDNISYAEQHVNRVEPSFIPTVPTAPGPVPSISVIEHLDQGTYAPKQCVKGTPAGPVYFNGGRGVSLGSLAALANGGDPAFDAAASIGDKASVRFELPQFSGHSIQVRVRHGDKKGREGRPITVREMGDTVFDVLRKLMSHGEARGEPLRHGGSVVDIERVVLLRVDQISKGSIQPILGIRNNG
ncbi:hypothetical protein GSI_10083 [Ganoderma sinense ZZ0214-1]|uniref:Uncharacterized protein n=1 Tax=Ganoderma sinense ZZ0214-1 TaxID=1077348 RepID=A0A2G8RZK9_9APHY|nr:hypothetical protein GSI_10083 [Ganoderma sinense ZZ0214-1]